MLKDYYQVRDWVEGFIPQVWGKEELGLRRIENLLRMLGNPERKFRSIHVAGTSGKGSTVFYIAKLLQCRKSEIRNPKPETNSNFQNYRHKTHFSNFPTKVGLHVSPHLVDIRERMQIFGEKTRRQEDKEIQFERLMPMGRFIGLMNEIKPVVEAIKSKQPRLTPSYFEILVAASLLYFAQEKVDWAVVEVGLGGRLDATNVLAPEISVITNIGKDHTDILGKTIEAIAFEKAGIIKKGIPVVTGASGKVLEVITKVAKEKDAELITISTLRDKNSLKSDILRYVSNHYYLLRSTVDSFASFNKNLALLAVLVLLGRERELEKKRVKVNSILEKRGVEKAFETQFPGRFEVIDVNVVLDGAHNTDKIRSLIEFVRKFPIPNSQFPIILVVAFKIGKDWQKMLELLFENLQIKKVIATQYQSVTDTGKGSAVDAEEIAEYLISNFPFDSKLAQGEQFPISNIKVIKNSQEAVFEALRPVRMTQGKQAQGKLSESFILVTGSLYLVGEVRTLWKLPEF